MATLGQQLKAAREAKGVNEHDAGIATKTLTKIIVAMEADDFSGMAAPTYAKGFIRLYANYLELDPEPLVEEYVASHISAAKPRLDEKKQQKNFRPAGSPSFTLKGLAPRLHLKDLSSTVAQFFSRVTHLRSQAAGNSSAKLTAGSWKKLPPVKDIRIVAAGVAGLLVLIVLVVSITNCARRRAAENPAPPTVEAPARPLIDGAIPDLYLVEPGKIESSR